MAADASLKRLGVEAIGLYQFRRPDPNTGPYEDSIGAVRDLLDAGKPGWPASRTRTRRRSSRRTRSSAAGSCRVQNQFSPAFRLSEPELEFCDKLGIAFLPWSPLGGGSRTPAISARSTPSSTELGPPSWASARSA